MVALHLVADGGKHYWIEPDSDQFHPHLTDDERLIARYGAARYGGPENFEIVRDNDFFNAAIVSVGRFGVIYSVVLRAVPQYSLHEQRRLTTWQAVRHRIPELNTDLYEEPSIPVHAARYLQIAVLATPKSNFTENLAGVTKRWNVPNASPPPGRAERVGRKIQPFSTLTQAPVFEFAGNSFPYVAGHPRGAFFDHACAYSDLVVGLLEAVEQALEDFINSAGEHIPPIFKDIAKGIGSGLPFGPAWETILDIIKDILDHVVPDMRLAEAMDAVREGLLDDIQGIPGVEAIGLFLWQVIANELFKILQADDDVEAISYAIMDSHHYRDVNCRKNVDSIEVFFGVEEPTVWNLIAFVDALLEFEKQQEFNGKAFFGYISLRFTGRTSALIGMERSEVTCAVEIACLKDMEGSQEMLDYAEKLARDPNVNACAHDHSSRSVTAIRARAARIAGGTPPTRPINSAKATPETSSGGVIRNANARCENVCQFMVPVVSPFSGSTTAQPSRPPTRAMQSDSMTNETITLPAPNPSARIVAISRARSVTAEYIVLSAPNTAPMPITAATMEPSTVMSVVSWRDCFA